MNGLNYGGFCGASVLSNTMQITVVLAFGNFFFLIPYFSLLLCYAVAEKHVVHI